jgi:hypothetical protein
MTLWRKLIGTGLYRKRQGRTRMAMSPHFVVCRTAGKIAAWTIFGGSGGVPPSGASPVRPTYPCANRSQNRSCLSLFYEAGARREGWATIRRESKFRVINSLATPDPYELTLSLREWGKGNRYEHVKPIRAWRRPMESECFSKATSRQAKHLNTTVGG